MSAAEKREIIEHDGESKAVASYRPTQETTLLGIIERVACNPEADIERMQALLKMRAEEEERQRRIAKEDREEEAKREWIAAFSAVQAEIGPIFRSKKNTHTGSMYADLADIERIVTPILTSHGFMTTAQRIPCEVNGHIRMRLTIGHKGGHERHYEGDFPLDAAGSQGKVNKTPLQAQGSTESYGRRYLKASALDLSFTDDKDGNSQNSRPLVTDTEIKVLRAKLEKVGKDEQKLLDWLKCDHIEQLTMAEFDRSIKMLNRAEREQEKASA